MINRTASLIGIAALFLATGAQAEEVESTYVLRERCKNGATYWCDVLNERSAPSRAYAEKDYIWDCASYRWKWEDRTFGARHGYKTLADACVMRTCRSADNWSMCAHGNLGYVPRKLREQQLRDLGRVPKERYVKEK
jgi:hypothetical protein